MPPSARYTRQSRPVTSCPAIGPDTMRQNAASVGSSMSAQPKNWNPVTPCTLGRPAAARTELLSTEGSLNVVNSFGFARISE